MKPRIAITLGDPAGIGPEIVAKAIRDSRVLRACIPIVLGAPGGVAIGKPSRAAGQRAIDALTRGLTLVSSGAAHALVTAPVSKESFHLAHYGFPGHTEWLAASCHATDVAMLMASGPLRALLMTRHIPLSEVCSTLKPSIVQKSAELGYRFVKNVLKVNRPRLVACGINPHAGDGGIIGKDEVRILLPALRALKRKNIPVMGPLASDSIFPQMAEGRFDLALAAYHDQGMIPLKVYAPERVVNITLGLPFIRTSPGHGTAYDIAGKRRARPGAMIEAILLAARYC